MKNHFIHSWSEYLIIVLLVSASVMLTLCGWDTLWDTVRTITGICLGSWIMYAIVSEVCDDIFGGKQ